MVKSGFAAGILPAGAGAPVLGVLSPADVVAYCADCGTDQLFVPPGGDDHVDAMGLERSCSACGAAVVLVGPAPQPSGASPLRRVA
jgi:hypothetical protein